MKKAIILRHLTENFSFLSQYGILNSVCSLLTESICRMEINMLQYIAYCMGIFFVVLEIIVLFYIFQTMINMGTFIRKISLFMVAPILQPVQALVRRSVMNTFLIDLSPYILLIILFYFEQLCNYLLNIS